MQIEIILVGVFALLTIGRVVWEKKTQPKRDRADDAKWMNAIR